MSKQKLNLIFAGTPEFAAEILDHLLKNTSHNLTAIYTQPDRRAGRGKKLSPSKVKELVNNFNSSAHNTSSTPIAIEQPENFKKSNPDYQKYIATLKNYQPDLMIVVAYGLILPKEVLDIPKYGCINIHASILPRWRGAAPIQRAILAGDTESGIAIQQMDTGLDTGDVISEAKCEITNKDTSITLSEKLNTLAKPLLLETLDNIAANKINLTKQNESYATYAHKLDKAESIIDLNQDALLIDRQIRAFTPWPGAQINLLHSRDNLSIKIWQAEPIITNTNASSNTGTIIAADKKGITIQCGINQLKISQLQFSGGKVITAQDALNGKYKDLFIIGHCLI